MIPAADWARQQVAEARVARGERAHPCDGCETVGLTSTHSATADTYASNYNPGFTATATEMVKQLGLAVAGRQSIEDTVAAIRKAAQENLEAAGG